jgi:hypothetical protein
MLKLAYAYVWRASVSNVEQIASAKWHSTVLVAASNYMDLVFTSRSKSISGSGKFWVKFS